MRQLLSFTLLLLIAAGCKKNAADPTFYTATFTRTVNGGAPWTWAFTSKTGCTLTFTQTFYTGATTGGKKTRWTLFLSDPPDQGSLNLSFPGSDSSATLPTGKDILLASRITLPDPIGFSGALMDKGSLYAGVDSAFLDLNLAGYNEKTLTATFSCQLYSQGTVVTIANGHLTNIPVTLASR